MAKRTEVARWISIMAKLDHKMEMERLNRSKQLRNDTAKKKEKK